MTGFDRGRKFGAFDNRLSFTCDRRLCVDEMSLRGSGAVRDFVRSLLAMSTTLRRVTFVCYGRTLDRISPASN